MIRLVPRAIVRGIVVDESGVPVAGATVVAAPQTASGVASRRHPSIMADDYSYATITAAAGSWMLALPPGTYTITIAKESFRTLTIGALTLAPGATADIGATTLPPDLRPTRIIYTGPQEGRYGSELVPTAVLTERDTGEPLGGRTLTFDLGGELANGVTDAAGSASVTFTPAMPRGDAALAIRYAGETGWAPAEMLGSIAIRPGISEVTYVWRKTVAVGVEQPLEAIVRGGDAGVPVDGVVVTFRIAGAVATAVTGVDGRAVAPFIVPSAMPTGEALLEVSFAGSELYDPARAEVSVLLYQATSFVVWGGNPEPLKVGDGRQFWGKQWNDQVAGGDYHAGSEFLGWGKGATMPPALCQPEARTTTLPALSPSCWTAKPGSANPPATIAAYIGVIVATSIAKDRGTIYGNVAATAVIEVDPSMPYTGQVGKPAFGRVVARIEDPLGLIANPPAAGDSAAAARIESNEPSSDPGSLLARMLDRIVPRPRVSLGVAADLVAAPQLSAPELPPAGASRHHLYTPELQLMMETTWSTVTPVPEWEYIWFGGEPLVQVEVATGTVRYYFNDHLATPKLQTDAAGSVVWRLEHEPYGQEFTYPVAGQHPQPLRFPGQEAQSVPSARYNIFRWYRSGWGRFTQSDPAGLKRGLNLYGYAGADPISFLDPLGLAYFAKRPLKGLPWLGPFSCNPLDDWLDDEISHEHLFFEDALLPGDVGFASNGTLYSGENPAEYQCKSGNYNDCIMRKAVEKVGAPKPYCLLWKAGSQEKFNCQDWTDLVRHEYAKLAKEKSVKEECCKKKGQKQ